MCYNISGGELKMESVVYFLVGLAIGGGIILAVWWATAHQHQQPQQQPDVIRPEVETVRTATLSEGLERVTAWIGQGNLPGFFFDARRFPPTQPPQTQTQPTPPPQQPTPNS